MKPALSPQMTGFLPSLPTRTLTSSSTCGSVTTVRMISTRFCTGAGLKKCTPTTRPGDEFAVEISVTDSDEVLVARIVSGFTMSSSCRKMSFLICRDSTTASTTKSASARSFDRGGQNDPPEQLGLLGLGDLPPLHRTTGRVLEVLAPPLEALVVDLDPDHLVAVAGEHLGDSGAHRAEADHADRGEFALS